MFNFYSSKSAAFISQINVTDNETGDNELRVILIRLFFIYIKNDMYRLSYTNTLRN